MAIALTFVSLKSANISAANETTTQAVTTKAKQKPKPKLLNGWKGKRYYVKGKYVVGKKKINKKWYVFGKDGKVRKKTTKVGKTTYY